jgi:serine/threonine protein kinase
MTTQVKGTLRWQAPELIPDMQGPEPDVSESRKTMATDIYAYGLVCYEVNHVSDADKRVTKQYRRCSPTIIHSPISLATCRS